MASLPYWSDSASLPTFSKLDRDTDADVVVIGGGITGLTTAYLLAAAGRSVVLLERGRCAEVDTGHTSAHLTMVTDTRLTELVERFGRTHAQAVWDAGRAAIAQIDEIACEHEIDCAFKWVDGYLHAPDGRADAASGRGVSRRGAAGLRARVRRHLHDHRAVRRRTRHLLSRSGALPPAPVSRGRGAALARAGGRIFEHSEAEEFRDDAAGRQGQRALGDVPGHRDGHAQSARRRRQHGQRHACFRPSSRCIRATSWPAACRAGTVPDALFWDTADPYRYVRLESHRNHDLLIVGGEDHKTGQAASTGGLLRSARAGDQGSRAATSLFTHRWSGQVIETPDGLPYIGRDDRPSIRRDRLRRQRHDVRHAQRA